MQKEKIHHVSDAKGNPELHGKHAAHAMAQIAAGHYGIKNLSISGASQTKLDNGDVHIHGTVDFIRYETDPAAPAAEPSV